MKYTIILPCYNEEKSIGKCIEDIKKVMKKNYEIIVVDSGNDNSYSITLGKKAKLTFSKKGYGNALRRGFEQAKGKYIIYADSDGTYDFNDLPKFTEALKEYNLVIGYRWELMQKGAMSLTHKIGNKVLTFVWNIMSMNTLLDTHCGFRAIRKSELDELELKEEGWQIAIEILNQADNNRLSIAEVPIHYYKRQNSESKLRTFVDGFGHLKYIFMSKYKYVSHLAKMGKEQRF